MVKRIRLLFKSTTLILRFFQIKQLYGPSLMMDRKGRSKAQYNNCYYQYHNQRKHHHLYHYYHYLIIYMGLVSFLHDFPCQFRRSLRCVLALRFRLLDFGILGASWEVYCTVYKALFITPRDPLNTVNFYFQSLHSVNFLSQVLCPRKAFLGLCQRCCY